MNLKKFLAIVTAVVFAMTMTVVAASAMPDWGIDWDNIDPDDPSTFPCICHLSACDNCTEDCYSDILCVDCNCDGAEHGRHECENCCEEGDCATGSNIPWLSIGLVAGGVAIGALAIAVIGNVAFWGTTLGLGALAAAGWVVNTVAGWIFG